MSIWFWVSVVEAGCIAYLLWTVSGLKSAKKWAEECVVKSNAQAVEYLALVAKGGRA